MIDVCSNCSKFIAQKDKVLTEAESVFDAAFDLNHFQEECFKKCHNNPDRVYSIKEVAELLYNIFGSSCACDYNGNDEWLPLVCDGANTICIPDASKNPTYCWEQYLKHLHERDSLCESK